MERIDINAPNFKGNDRRRGNAPFTALIERGFIVIGVILSAMLFSSMLARPAIVADPVSSGIATAGLIVSAIYGGWFYAGPRNHAATIGVSVGVPLGFFFFQNSYAREASMHDLVSGSGRIMALAAVLAVVTAISAWVWRRFLSHRFPALSASD
jgi:hypothetical protein